MLKDTKSLGNNKEGVLFDTPSFYFINKSIEEKEFFPSKARTILK